MKCAVKLAFNHQNTPDVTLAIGVVTNIALIQPTFHRLDVRGVALHCPRGRFLHALFGSHWRGGGG